MSACGPFLNPLYVLARWPNSLAEQGQSARHRGGRDAPVNRCQNVQIVDMNALNAALAVNRWKRHVGIYADLEGEHFSLYASDGNDITNEDQ